MNEEQAQLKKEANVKGSSLALEAAVDPYYFVEIQRISCLEGERNRRTYGTFLQ